MTDNKQDSPIPDHSEWVCCQLGAREHYAVPRALDRRRVLSELVTDFWFPKQSVLDPWSKGLADRFHPELKEAKVRSANLSSVLFEMKSRARDLNGWQLIGRRNDWFQNVAVSELARHAAERNGTRTNVFAYSYAAGKILKFAKGRSWPTVLGQIDPGPAEERIVAQLHEDAGRDRLWEPAPAQYWDDWRLECELADRIVVNSDWSRIALESEGVPATKISVIPLAFEPTREAISFKREYPEVFTAQRPLRVLFLGQINLRKGVRELLEAVKLLSGEPVEFWFVGPVQFAIPKPMQSHSCIRWFGSVRRHDVGKYYQTADLFVFPTLSDGFGLTQLEAQSWKLPIIASSHCGSVVENDVNGLILREVSGESIAKTLLELLRSPESLQKMSNQSSVREQFSLDALSSALVNG